MIRVMAYDRGEATAQAVIVVPVILFILWLAIQATVFLHGANVAGAAASEGAAVASRYGATMADGERAIRRTLNVLDVRNGGSWSVRKEGGHVTATVNLPLPRIVPFFPRTVSRSAREPVEQFLREGQR